MVLERLPSYYSTSKQHRIARANSGSDQINLLTPNYFAVVSYQALVHRRSRTTSPNKECSRRTYRNTSPLVLLQPAENQRTTIISNPNKTATASPLCGTRRHRSTEYTWPTNLLSCASETITRKRTLIRRNASSRNIRRLLWRPCSRVEDWIRLQPLLWLRRHRCQLRRRRRAFASSSLVVGSAG